MSHRTDLTERLDRDYADPWKPDAGDKLEGVVTEITQRDGGYGPYPIVVVREDDGTELAIHAYHAVLKNELARQKPQIGERIAIKYAGRRTSAAGKPFESYKVAVDRPARAFDWGTFGDPSDTDPAPAVSDIPATLEQQGGDVDDIPF